MKKFRVIAVFMLCSVFAAAQTCGSKYQSGITPIPDVSYDKIHHGYSLSKPNAIMALRLSPNGDTARLKQLKAKLDTAALTRKEMRELNGLQFENTSNPNLRHFRTGIGMYVISQHISVTQCFGRSGFGNRLSIENKIGLQYESYQIFNLQLNWRDIEENMTIGFAWNNKPGCRISTGVGYYLLFFWMEGDKLRESLDSGYPEIMPIKIEYAPEKVPKLNFVAETLFKEVSGLHVDFGVTYYVW